MADLSQKSAHAVKWNAIGTIARFALQLIAQIVLSRILGPASYGLFGLGLIVYTFGNFFSSFGFGRQLLQKQTITDLDIRFAFTWQVILGSIATIVIFICSGIISEYFKSPELVPIVQWLSLACVINAATAPSNNLLARDLNYKKLAKIQFISYLTSYIVVGIPLAIQGYGVYALLIAWMLQLILILVLTFVEHPHSLKPLFWFDEAKDAMNYGGTVFVTNIVNWILTNIDRVVVGRFFSVHIVGLYTVSYNLATLPNSLLLNGLQTIFLTSGAKTGSNVSKLRDSYLQVTSTILIVILPIFVTLSCLSPLIMQVLYGDKWVGSGEILAVMFLGIPALVTWGLSTPILWNMGKKHHEALLQLPIILISLFAFFIFGSSGVMTVAWIFVLMAYARSVVMLISALNSLDLGIKLLLPATIRAGVFSCLFYLVCHYSIVIASEYVTALPQLIFAGFSSLAFALLIAFKFTESLGADVLKMLSRFHNHFQR